MNPTVVGITILSQFLAMRVEKFNKFLQLLVFLTILGAPLYVIRFNYFGLPTTFLENLLVFTFFLWVARKVFNRNFNLTRTPLEKPILLFILAAFISLFTTPDLRGGLGILKAYIIEPIIFFYIIINGFDSSQSPIFVPERKVFERTWLRLVIGGLLLAAFWISLLGIIQVIFKVGIFAPHEALANRAHAVYQTGNAIGLFVGPIFLLALGVWALNPFSTTRYLLPLLFVFFAAIWLSKSAGSLVALSLSVVVFILLVLYRSFFSVRLTKMILLILRLILLVTVVLGVLFFLNLSRWTPQVSNPWERPKNDTLTLRLCLWEGARNLIWDRPFWGAGLSGFKEIYSQEYYTCDAEPLEYPHNFFLNFWTEMGLLGIAAMVWILCTFYQSLFKIYLSGGKEKKRERDYLAMALMSGMTYSLVHGLVDVPYFKNDLALEFWVMLALATILKNSPPSLETKRD